MNIHSSVITELKTPELVLDQLKNFYDPQIDYSKFFARVTDYSGNIFKLETANTNIKFLVSGDPLKLTFRKGLKECDATLRQIEDEKYLVVFIGNIFECYPKDLYFRRGSIARLNIPIMHRRIQEASHSYLYLLKSKDDFYVQLNDVNNFLWNYEEEKILLANDYDAKIMQLRQEKDRALKDLVTQRNDSIKLQQELKQKIDTIEQDVVNARADTRELDMDRWNLDNDNRSTFELRPGREE